LKITGPDYYGTFSCPALKSRRASISLDLRINDVITSNDQVIQITLWFLAGDKGSLMLLI